MVFMIFFVWNVMHQKTLPKKTLSKSSWRIFFPGQKLTEIYFTKSVLEFDVKTPNYKMLEIRWNCRWMSIFRYWTHHCVCKCIEAIKKQNQSCLWWPRFRSFYFYQCWRRDGKRERERKEKIAFTKTKSRLKWNLKHSNSIFDPHGGKCVFRLVLFQIILSITGVVVAIYRPNTLISLI